MVNVIMAEDPIKNDKGWSALNLICDYLNQDFETFFLNCSEDSCQSGANKGIHRTIVSSNEKSQYGSSNQFWGHLTTIWILYVL